MTNAETIHRYLTENTPEPYCDDCIGKNTSMTPRQQVYPIAAALGLTTDFDRQEAVCSDCRAIKLVTRSLRHAAPRSA